MDSICEQMDERIDLSSIDVNEDMTEVKEIVDYMIELVSMSTNSQMDYNNDNQYNDDSNDNEIELSQTRSLHCIINEDDDQDMVDVKDLIDYMLELVSTAVPFNSSKISPNMGSFGLNDDDDIEVIDLESEDLNDNENCFICGKRDEIKYQIKINGKIHNSCSWDCVQKLKNNDYCISCCSLISNESQAYRPNFGGGNASLCSEECLIRFDAEHQPNSECFTCHNVLVKDKKIFYWQTMEFCSAECVQTKQLVFGSKCAQCQTPVNRQSLGKYSVRFGDIIKQFCIGTCLEAFKKSLKVCAFCQKDLKFCATICIATFGFGDKMRLREFCDQICKSQYGLILNSKSSYQIECYQCQRLVDSKSIIDFTFENKKYSLCSSTCVAAFKYNNKLKIIFCENCHKYDWSGVSNSRNLHILHFSGMTGVFCTKKCMSMYVLKNRKIVACLCCKVKKYNFDLIESYDWSKNESRLFCSLNCLTLHDIAETQKDKIQPNVANKVQCNHCNNYCNPQFYLKSNEKLHKFCSYQCVFQFQRQFAPNSLIALPQSTNTTTASNIVSFSNDLTLCSSSMQSTMWTPSFFNQSQRPQLQQKVQTSTPLHLTQVRPNIITQRNIPLSTVNKTLPSSVPPITTNAVSIGMPSSDANTGSTTTTSSVGNQTIIKEIVKETKEVIVKVPVAKQVKNKCTLFRPPMQTKATSCRPFQVSVEVQTDPPMKVICPILLPIPIFVPIPVAYMQPLAVPLPLPIPIIVESKPEPIEKSTNELNGQQTSFSSDNLNLTEQQIGELLTLPQELLGESQTIDANVVDNILMDSGNDYSNASASKRGNTLNESDVSPSKRGRRVSDGTPRGRGRGRGRGGRGGRGRGRGSNKKRKEWEMSSSEEEEEEIPSENDSEFEPEVGQMESSQDSRDSEELQQAYAAIPGINETDQTVRMVLTTKRGRGRGRKSDTNQSQGIDLNMSMNVVEEPKKAKRGRKRKEVTEETETDFESQLSTNTTNNGINALRIWLRQSAVYFKTKNILELHQNYLSEIFCKFVEEICQVHGQEYSPDYIYMLCLDLQRHLAENNRLDNIFMDASYKQFIHAIHSRLVGYNPQLTCISEEKLWDCGQLGAHSPTVLLNTVMFLATKYFNLSQLEEHTQFAFSHLQKQWTADGTQCLIYQIIRRGRGKRRSLVIYENTENQLRCPVKLFEFYLSKCPENVIQRRDMFYLYPIEGCVPDSNTWYSSNALTNASVNKMLQRILVVQEIVALGSQPNFSILNDFE